MERGNLDRAKASGIQSLTGKEGLDKFDPTDKTSPELKAALRDARETRKKATDKPSETLKLLNELKSHHAKKESETDENWEEKIKMAKEKIDLAAGSAPKKIPTKEQAGEDIDVSDL